MKPFFSDWPLQAVTVCAATGTSEVLIDLWESGVVNPQLCISATYAATASTTGFSVKIYRGYKIDDEIVYTTAGDTITMTSQPTPSQGTPQTVVNDFAIDPTVYPRRLKMILTNLDNTNSFSYIVAGDR